MPTAAKLFACIAAFALSMLPVSNASASDQRVLMSVQERGYVRCGVHRSGVGLAEIRADGAWAGLFVEFCRVIAIAALGDSRAIQVVEVDDMSANLALSEGQVDVVTSSILVPDRQSTSSDVIQLAPLLEDQQLIVSFLSDVPSIGDLPAHARICTSNHPAIRANLANALQAGPYGAQVVGYASIDGLFNAYFRQRCDAVSYHHFAIMAQSLLRSSQRVAAWPSSFGFAHIAFGPTVRDSDPEWIAIVDAAVRAATHDVHLNVVDVPHRVRDGFIERVHSISNSATAIYDRTLGHMGGQGFYPAGPLPSGS